jgi:hypothetical protein
VLHPSRIGPKAKQMKLRCLSIFTAIIAFSMVALAQDAPLFDVYQARYLSNLNNGDSSVNLTNTGANVPVLAGAAVVNAAAITSSNICANVYVFSPDEQLISCCSCPVTPNALVSLSARNDLISNTLTPAVPTSIVVKLLGSAAPICNAATVGSVSNPLTTGLAAWATTLHVLPVTPGSPAITFGRTETPFVSSTLSGGELRRLTNLCLGIQAIGSGFGICRSCRFGGFGSVQQ